MRKEFFKSILVAGFFISTGKATYAQSYAEAVANADTTNFIANAKEGWQLFNSYVATQDADSIQIELIIQHENNINWMDEQCIGAIKTASLRPTEGISIVFPFSMSNYSLRVENDGKCYLKFINGALPYESPFVISTKVIFKK